MAAGNNYYVIIQDTVRAPVPAQSSKSGVQISLDPVKILPSAPLQRLSEEDILVPREQVVPPRKIFFRKKLPENTGVLNDTTQHLLLPPDLALAQITVKPAGVILPSHPLRYHSNDWFTFLFLLTLLILALVRSSTKKYFNLLLQSVGSIQASARMYREQNISLVQGSSAMEVFYLIVMALFGYQISQFAGIDFPLPGVLIFLICLAAIFIFIQTKYLIYKMLGFFSETSADTREYLFNIQNYHRMLGLLLWPIVAAIAWLPIENSRILLFTGLFLTALINLLYLIRGARILIKKHYSIFYLFLYLCSLEILPLLLFLKVLQTSSG
jgi:hypothetical protein